MNMNTVMYFTVQDLFLIYLRGPSIKLSMAYLCDEIMKKKTYFARLFMLLLVSCTLEGCMQGTPSAWDVYATNQPQQAYQALHELALDGDADAQFLAGRMLMLGEGVEQNPKMGIQLYLQAAEQNHACAMSNLAAEYKSGIHVPRDFHKAFLWAQKASHSQHPMALTTLGESHFLGQGTAVDKKNALPYYQQALQQGGGSAAFLLGQYYIEASSSLKNQLEGLKWLYVHAIWQKDNALKVQRNNHPETDYKARYFDQVLKKTDPELQTKARKQAQEWYNENKETILSRRELVQRCTGIK